MDIEEKEEKEEKEENKQLIKEMKDLTIEEHKLPVNVGKLFIEALYLQEDDNFAGAIDLYEQALSAAKGKVDTEAKIKAHLGVLLLNSTIIADKSRGAQYIIDALKAKNTPRHIWHFVVTILSVLPGFENITDTEIGGFLRTYLKDTSKLGELHAKIIEARNISWHGEKYNYGWRLTS